ncbi:MAG: hypothetical protein ACLPWF_06705 [Bryobacteraceae bacterium]
MKQLLSLLFLSAAIAAAQNESAITRDGAYWVRTIRGSIDIASSDRLRVETTGNMTLRGAAGQQSSYTLTVRVRAADAREAETLLDRVNVKTGTEGGWAYLMVAPPRLVSSGELTVTGPRALRQVWAQTHGGNVQASDWDGDFEARSAGGRIAVDRIRGRGELRTAGGDIEVGAVNGPLRCSSGGGVIRVQNAGAEAWLETAGGEIFVHQADGPVQASTGGGNIRIERAGSTVVARTAGGLIQVQQADGPVTAESSGGAIQVNSANGVRCESAGGAIRLRNVAGAVHALANSGNILAELGPGRDASSKAMEDSILSTNAGDITVFIPSNLRLTVQAINETGGGSGRINSDFPDIHPRMGGFAGAGPLVAEGALNGGGPMLRVNVVGGTIYLRRAK